VNIRRRNGFLPRGYGRTLGQNCSGPQRARAAASARSSSTASARGLDEDETIESTWGDQKTLSMMRLAAQAVQSLGNVQNAKVHWTADVDLFDAALEAITGTLRVFRPHVFIATGFATCPPELGTPALRIIREAQAADPTRPLNRSTKRQRAMTRLKEDLGEEL
jgi:hypothetical protein